MLSMMAENSHLISKMPERETGLPKYLQGHGVPMIEGERSSRRTPCLVHKRIRKAS